ncbi:MAG: hypothetical protein ACK4FP_03370 [Azonexus sp.]
MANNYIQRVAAAALADFDGAMSVLGLGCGKNQGREYLPLNPKRSDHKPGSFTINRDSGAWSDFATGDKGGDLVALAAYVWDCRQGAAAERLGAQYGIAKPNAQEQHQPGERQAANGRPMQAADAVCLMPIPDDAPPPPVAHSRHGKPAGRWAYRDAAGVVCFYHDRYEPKGGAQAVCPALLVAFS